MVKLIFAAGPKGEFGAGNGLPWDCPEDLAHFKRETAGYDLIMSAATFRSLPGVLPGRVHIVIGDTPVVAKNGAEPHFQLGSQTTLENAIKFSENANVAVIGGRKLIDQAVPLCDIAMITKIDESYVKDADIFIDIRRVIDNLDLYLGHTMITQLGNHTLFTKKGLTLRNLNENK